MASEKQTAPPAAGDNTKTLRAVLIAALPVYLAIRLAAYGVSVEVATALCLSLLGIAERAWRLARKQFPTLGWILGGDGPDPTVTQVVTVETVTQTNVTDTKVTSTPGAEDAPPSS